jgi:hypothetical protein
MDILIFAKRFCNGNWVAWQHQCTEGEAEAVADSARAKAQDRLNFDSSDGDDYLAGARYIYDVAYGLLDHPRDGDTRVHAVSVNGMLIAMSEEPARQITEPHRAA